MSDDAIPIPAKFLTETREIIWTAGNDDFDEFSHLEATAFPHHVDVDNMKNRTAISIWIRDHLEHAWTTNSLRGNGMQKFEYRFQTLTDATMFKLRFG